MSELITFKVAGVTFDNRQCNIGYLRKQIKASIDNNEQVYYITYRREKDNIHDSNAIAVYAHIIKTKKRVQLGYIPRELAKEIAPLIDSGKKIFTHTANILGGRILGVEITISLYTPRTNINIAYNKI